jgi:hypothetical protein
MKQLRIKLFTVFASTETGYITYGVYLAPSASFAIGLAEKEHGPFPNGGRHVTAYPHPSTI